MKDKVLLVDDDAMVLAGLRRQLRNQFRIDTALSGEEALQQVQENGPYAVIVSDYMMPGMNGFDVCQSLREKIPTQPILMLTAMSEGDGSDTEIHIRGRDLRQGRPKSIVTRSFRGLCS